MQKIYLVKFLTNMHDRNLVSCQVAGFVNLI